MIYEREMGRTIKKKCLWLTMCVLRCRMNEERIRRETLNVYLQCVWMLRAIEKKSIMAKGGVSNTEWNEYEWVSSEAENERKRMCERKREEFVDERIKNVWTMRKEGREWDRKPGWK